jgi:hypothetical protein
MDKLAQDMIVILSYDDKETFCRTCVVYGAHYQTLPGEPNPALYRIHINAAKFFYFLFELHNGYSSDKKIDAAMIAFLWNEFSCMISDPISWQKLSLSQTLI